MYYVFLFYYATYIYKYINKYHFVFVIYEVYFLSWFNFFSFLLHLLFSSLFGSLLLRLYVFHLCFTV